LAFSPKAGNEFLYPLVCPPLINEYDSKGAVVLAITLWLIGPYSDYTAKTSYTLYSIPPSSTSNYLDF
jgi:hypothetical protein